MKLIATAVLSVVAVLIALVGPAAAETVTKSDPRPDCSDAAPLDVRRATFSYRENAYKVRIKMGDLSKRRTQVLSRYIVGSGENTKLDVMLRTRYVKGERRTTGRYFDYTNDDYGRFRKGLKAEWNWRKDTITFTLRSHLRGNTATGVVYSVPKGQQHGDSCGDIIVVRGLERG